MRTVKLSLAVLLGALGAASAQLVSPPDADQTPEQGLTAAATLLRGASAHFTAVKCTKVGPTGAVKCTPKPTAPILVHTTVPRGQFEVVVHKGHAYIHMNSTVQASFTTLSMSGPVAVGKLNGVSVRSAATRIKTMTDIIVTVDAGGNTVELVMTKTDIEAIEALGAKKDPATGTFPAREYLRFQLTAPVDRLEVEVLSPKDIIFDLRTLLYF